MFTHLTIFYFLVVPAAFQVQGAMTFTAAELEVFASMQLCNHFGGLCGLECPFRFIRHRWNIPLCPFSNQECCIGPPRNEFALNRNDEEESPVTTTLPPAPPPPASTTTPESPESEPELTCGLVPSASSSSRRRKRIVGGEISSVGRWPWLVALRSVLGSHTCAGAVIHPRWILTAAHCFKHISNPSLWRVRVGEFDLLRHDTGERDLNLNAIITHPSYRSSSRNSQANENQTLYARYVHDIALVRLAQDADVTPICLPPETNGTGSDHNDSQDTATTYGQCWVAGWGVTMDSVIDDQMLRQVTGEVIDSHGCGQMWGTPLRDDMLCFGNGTFGPCTGDSGGPLSCHRNGNYFLEGVVSWGTENCTRNGYPSVFTKVRSYLPWIASEMTAVDDD